MIRLAVEPPYRLDLTVAILRRFDTNVVDTFADGTYMRAFGESASDPIVVVRQTSETELTLSSAGDGDAEDFVPIVRRMLGLDADISLFLRRGSSVPWLKPVMKVMRAVRPPRYPSLWEACVNAVVFQQVSIASASAMLRRAVEAISSARTHAGQTLYAFPSASAVSRLPAEALMAHGLSMAKAATIGRVAAAILDGTLSEAQLAPLPSLAISDRLREIKGIGPWTAAIVLLRGFGRLDVFPEGDSGAARSLQLLSPGVDADAVSQAREVIGDREGLLYYTLLMGRLIAKGAVKA